MSNYHDKAAVMFALKERFTFTLTESADLVEKYGWFIDSTQNIPLPDSVIVDCAEQIFARHREDETK